MNGGLVDDGSAIRPAEIAAWQAIRDILMDHLAVRRAEVSDRIGMSFIKAKALRRLTSGPMTMGGLTAALNTDAPYTSVVVDDLVDRDLAVRIAHPDDRRRKLVGLTAAGMQVALLAEEILDRPPAGFLRLTEPELAQLTQIFARIAEPAVPPVS